MLAIAAPSGASPLPVAKTRRSLSGDQSGWVASIAPGRVSATWKFPVARSSCHMSPAQAATTEALSGLMVAKPWPSVSATLLTRGVGGAALVTSVIHRLLPLVAATGAAR